MHNDHIVYKEFESPIGTLIAGATKKGACLLEFEDRGGLDRIKKRILKRHRSEMSRGTNPFIDQLESEVRQYFEGKLKTFTVPMDLKGTPFQMAVWNQLLNIPYGKTRTYSEIATLVGKPGAMRAVGRANGDNYIAIAVPCHRVIQADGNLRGYGGGIWRKRRLLDLEKQNKYKES